ncbi:hypothetical protein ACLVWU_10605 [Bdellovibrio sp. HCB290]|uniref:hypothetical protein n=1 Tax=Bdellovibrio sp. HCB290 TaxID=3394356 RepID=UPI0039B5739A
MKVLSTAVLLSGLCLSGLAQASQVPNEVLNTYQLLRSYAGGFQSTGTSLNGGACTLELDYHPDTVVVILTGDESAFEETTTYLAPVTKVDSYSKEKVTVSNAGWDGEETEITLARTATELTVSAKYTFSEYYGGGSHSDTCIFKKK